MYSTVVLLDIDRRDKKIYSHEDLYMVVQAALFAIAKPENNQNIPHYMSD